MRKQSRRLEKKQSKAKLSSRIRVKDSDVAQKYNSGPIEPVDVDEDTGSQLGLSKFAKK